MFLLLYCFKAEVHFELRWNKTFLWFTAYCSTDTEHKKHSFIFNKYTHSKLYTCTIHWHTRVSVNIIELQTLLCYCSQMHVGWENHLLINNFYSSKFPSPLKSHFKISWKYFLDKSPAFVLSVWLCSGTHEINMKVD